MCWNDGYRIAGRVEKEDAARNEGRSDAVVNDPGYQDQSVIQIVGCVDGHLFPAFQSARSRRFASNVTSAMTAAIFMRSSRRFVSRSGPAA